MRTGPPDIDNQNAYWDRVSGEKTFTHPLDTEWLESLLDRQSAVLDFGCGYGRIVKQLIEAGYANTSGYDTSRALIRRGLLEHQLPIAHIESPEDLPVADCSQDCILLFAVFTCIPSNEAQLKLMDLLQRKLRPGGLIYISDYYLQEAGPEAHSYEYLNDDPENYGVFSLPEGAVFRHHSREWITRLTTGMQPVGEKTIVVQTMNGHPARAFQYIGIKPSLTPCNEHSFSAELPTAIQ